LNFKLKFSNVGQIKVFLPICKIF